jgi:DNA replication protein DnaC
MSPGHAGSEWEVIVSRGTALRVFRPSHLSPPQGTRPPGGPWGSGPSLLDLLLPTAGEFIRRRDNLVVVGQSGVGKSPIVQAIGHQACALGWRARYTTSAALLQDLRASLADQTLPRQVRYYARFDLLIIDEFGFDRIERAEAPQAASLLYKVVDARSEQRSTALVTNIDFEAWGEYLGDPPLAMALLDRIVDGAIILKIAGKSYRAHRAKPGKADASSKE